MPPAVVAVSLGTALLTGVPGTAPGCELLISLTPGEFLAFLPSQIGHPLIAPSWALPLPESLPDRTTLHFQGWHLDGSVFQLLGTRGLTVEMRK